MGRVAVLEQCDLETRWTVQAVRLSFWRRVWLLRGRARRWYLGWLRPGYVRANRARRVGECRRCGMCCQMGIRCFRLRTDDSLSGCTSYGKRRPINCRNFPIDERDLADRNVLAPHDPCGYRFLPRPARN